MENQNQSTPTYKLGSNVPEYIRQRFATANTNTHPKPKEEPEQTEQVEQEEVEQVETPAQTETPVEQPQTVETVETENNEVKSWKGRLNKEQEAHRDTSARLLAEAEARKKAEEDAKKLQVELETYKQQATQQTAQTQQPTEDDFTAEEIEELEMMSPTVRKLVERMRKQGQSAPMPNVDQIIEQRFEQVQAKQTEQNQSVAFHKALIEQVPEFQGLMTDSAFSEFLNNKTIDFAGNSAAMLVAHIGNTKDIARIPLFRQLIDEYNQSKQPPKEIVTAAPTGKAAQPRTPKAKPKMTAKDIAHKNMLVRSGKTKELMEFLAKFE
ncbi:hypothetical protein A1D22_05785 [Pasteurellaceae bacterium LFhippo2]|nr:hypothetical protein [Pasteurellaceae bacterium LFhippo2]